MLPTRYPATIYIGVRDMIRLVQRKGLPACIAGVAERIERDFLRWHEFDKRARLASHSAHGVIELMPEMIAPGMHINAVGGDCPGKTELHPGVLAAAAVFVEFEPQSRIEGEIQQMPADFPVTEFWQVLAGRHPGRADAAQITLFDSVGFALEDYSALGFVRDTAAELGIGEIIELVPQAADPKDLFGVLGAGTGSAAPSRPSARDLQDAVAAG